MIRIPAKIIIILVGLIAGSCTKTIYRDSSDLWSNDLLHGTNMAEPFSFTFITLPEL